MYVAIETLQAAFADAQQIVLFTILQDYHPCRITYVLD